MHMKQKTILVTLAAATLLLPLSAHARRGYWAPAGEKEVKEPQQIQSIFVQQLSDYHRARFKRFSPTQQKAAVAFFERGELSPDSAVEQIAVNELHKR